MVADDGGGGCEVERDREEVFERGVKGIDKLDKQFLILKGERGNGGAERKQNTPRDAERDRSRQRRSFFRVRA